MTSKFLPTLCARAKCDTWENNDVEKARRPSERSERERRILEESRKKEKETERERQRNRRKSIHPRVEIRIEDAEAEAARRR